MVPVLYCGGDAIYGDVHIMQSQAAAAAGGVKGVWLEIKTVIIHSGGRHGEHAKCAWCMSRYGVAKLNENMIDWIIVSETCLSLFPRRLLVDSWH